MERKSPLFIHLDEEQCQYRVFWASPPPLSVHGRQWEIVQAKRTWMLVLLQTPMFGQPVYRKAVQNIWFRWNQYESLPLAMDQHHIYGSCIYLPHAVRAHTSFVWSLMWHSRCCWAKKILRLFLILSPQKLPSSPFFFFFFFWIWGKRKE